ncbi:DNA/RNA non-specific endonuclease [Clostridium gasigenes]|uniref:DNA/RNA non-specific endonuclease n=1 Tax=Clostridium gasigenes TaxID=94869 RepID=UPI001C0E391E|nr:DNA/RNA non-specific endonuclease [Clostridium gasigenes]MBU3134439.1 DNA/RNA non-specific endonuclease [Clostridium gasigenes]
MKGFNIDFLGENLKVKVPTLDEELLKVSLNNGEIFDFTHFSLAMNKILKSAIYVASNVDKSKFKKIHEHRHWHFDSIIGEENQLGNNFYEKNNWDRGHLARRADLMWGSEDDVENAQYDSCCWANISLQHHEFNTGIWSKLEGWIIENPDILSKKLSIFTGPINGGGSMEYCGVKKLLGCGVFIPTAFWKVIFYINKSNNLKCISFIMSQEEYLKRGKNEGLKFLKPYEVSLKEISRLTNLKFEDNLYDVDVFNNNDNTIESKNQEAHLIEGEDDLILH